jgi:IS1 family transposase
LTKVFRLTIILAMNKLPSEARAKILSMLVEGMSMRAVSRIADVSINTVTKLLVDAGMAAEAFHDATVRNVRVEQLQCDEIWAFCKAKHRNRETMKKPSLDAGDTWTFTALDSGSKLIVSWFSGDRDGKSARIFLRDTASRITGPVQVNTDGFGSYQYAVAEIFGHDVSHGQVHKVFSSTPDRGPSRKYSPGIVVAQTKEAMTGNPDMAKVSTSHVERQNLNIRMGNRRFTRLTNGFSKKLENHSFSLAVYFFHHNFCRVQKSLRVTPAMAAGVTDELMDMGHLVRLIDMMEEPPKPRGPYKRKVV